MINDNVTLRGSLDIVVRNTGGDVVDSRSIHNLVVTVGKEWVASLMGTGTGTAMTHMAVGTNNTAPNATDTTLNTEVARVALTSTNVVGASIVYVGDFPAGTGTAALTEAGLFNAGGGGTMLSRTTYSVINKGASDTMQVTWTITVG